jgi:hypothetical protein
VKLGCGADGWLAGLSGCRHMIDSHNITITILLQQLLWLSRKF